MKTTPENPAAFPAEGGSDSGLHAAPGMTLRDYFAASAMQGFLSNSPWITKMASNRPPNEDPEIMDLMLAETSYALADAMLAARQQPQPGEG